MNNIIIFKGEDPTYFSHALKIRERVFSDEQGYDPKIDHDEIDLVAWHVMIRKTEGYVATGRLFIDEGIYHIGRVAVLKSYRGTHLGQSLMKALIKEARALNLSSSIMLHAQTHAVSFYEQLGFKTEGEQFLEEGEPHIKMVQLL